MTDITINNLKPRHRLFVKNYLDNGFNASKAYRDTYKTEKNADCKADDLMQREDIKSVILGKINDLACITREDYIAKTQQLMRECKNESVKARYWQILGQASDILRENTQTITTNVLTIDELNALSKEKNRPHIKADVEILGKTTQS